MLYKTIFSFSIVSVVLFFTGGNLFALFQGYIQNDQSVFSLTLDQFCIDKIQTPTDLSGKKLVVLRLDDVQAYSWRDISIAMIRDAQGYNAPIVAWVIPKDLAGDPTLTRFLKREHCNIEIAMHGWDHSGTGVNNLQIRYQTEFWNISYEEARNRINKGKEVLLPLSGRPILSFIPPFNVVSADAIRAIKDEWIGVTSSIWNGLYDYHSTTYNFDKKRMVPVTEVLQNCEDAFIKNGLCVVMMHPQDYSNSDKTLDQTAYRDYYLTLLESLTKDENIVFVTFENLITNRANGS